MPFIQLPQDFHRPKFAVADQKNRSSLGQKLSDIGQQRQLLARSAVSTDLFNPSPGNRDGSLAVSQADNQQLMPKSNPGAVYDQVDFSNVANLRFQPLPCDWLIPFSNSDGRIVQQSVQSPRGTRQLGFSRYFSCDPAQTHLTAQIDPDHQPDKCPNLGDPLPRTQFQNSHFPCIIELVDRHVASPGKWFCRRNKFTRFCPADQLSVFKVSGG